MTSWKDACVGIQSVFLQAIPYRIIAQYDVVSQNRPEGRRGAASQEYCLSSDYRFAHAFISAGGQVSGLGDGGSRAAAKEGEEEGRYFQGINSTRRGSQGKYSLTRNGILPGHTAFPGYSRVISCPAAENGDF